MGIQLYKHNAEAYSRAVRLLENTGRAAVIHPTGTGKTYIAFKLCEDNAGSRILWLSPSEYIFKTQLENARRDGFSAKNITFLTYSVLLNRTDEDIAALAPDFIVLDEFHRVRKDAFWTVYYYNEAEKNKFEQGLLSLGVKEEKMSVLDLELLRINGEQK